MRFRSQWTTKTWLRLWFYVAIIPIWDIVTEMVYQALTGGLAPRDIVFTTVRGAVLYVIMVWLLYRLIHRLDGVEQRYQNLVHISPQPFFVHSHEKWVYANPAGLNLIGAERPSDIMGRSIWESVHPDDRKVTTALLDRLRATAKPMDIHGARRFLRLDGKVLDVELLAAPLPSDDKSAIQVLYTDVTERKRIEGELRMAVALLESFLEHHADAICIYSMSGHLTKMNSRCEELYGISRDEFIGTHFTELPFVPEDKHKESEALVELIHRGETVAGCRTTRRHRNGEHIYVSLSGFSMLDANEELIGWATTVRDISDEVNAEQHLLQSEKLAAVGQLAAGVAHEIRNPLTSVLGFLQLLQTNGPAKMDQYIGIMTHELKRITTIVTEMLALAKPHPETFQLVDISELLAQVEQMLEPEAVMRGAELRFAFTGVNAYISGRENRLKQVLINLVRNAMDALTESSRDVFVTAVKMEGCVRIDIRDTGVGISEEQLRRMGEPFYTTKANGTGLGLHVCRQIVEQHNGTLQFESEVGRGTTVHLAFPLPG